jgi:hypothetical protein
VPRGSLAAALAALVLGSGLPAGAQAPCTPAPEPARWLEAGTPDRGRAEPIIAVHRGAAALAPENTIAAFEYAIAYDVEMIEVDVQQTADHRFVAFHDLDVAKKTDGTGTFPLLTYEQARALNVADNDTWRGSAYDPSRMPSLEEVLALADLHEVGIMFDLKESVTDAATVANMAAAYEGLLARSVFIPYVPGRAEMIKAAQPSAQMNFSNQLDNAPGREPPGSLFALAAEYWSFGSDLPAFDAEDVAEIHDGCGLVIPNVYQGDVTGSEAGDLAHALTIGADGAQVNRPEIAAEVLGEPVATRFDGPCLVDAEHGLGLPGKTVHVRGATAVTGRGGCVDAGPGVLRFGGDGSALPSHSTAP